MKIGIYTPYLDSFGGGERYVLTVAETLSQEHEVELFLDAHQLTLDPENLIQNLSRRLNLDLSKVKIKKAPVGGGSNIIERISFFKKYDLVFYLTDGSIFYSSAKRSIIHFQVPFKNTVAHSWWGKIKLSTWALAICNSKFTETVIKQEWSIPTRVIYPPVAVESIKPLQKKKQILSVGRFTSFSKSKKHEEMIQTFKKLHQIGKIKGWSLHLAGSVEGDESYVGELKEQAKDLPITFYPNLPFKDLVNLYGESSIYWHAAGWGEEDPAKMEHFGITTVEAMAAGCVPVVINKGGQPEIVEDGKSGFLWDYTDKLQLLTLKLINNPKLMSQLSSKATVRSKMFSKTIFQQSIKSLLT